MAHLVKFPLVRNNSPHPDERRIADWRAPYPFLVWVFLATRRTGDVTRVTERLGLAGMLASINAARRSRLIGIAEASCSSPSATVSAGSSSGRVGRKGNRSAILPAETSSKICASLNVLRRVTASTTAPRVAGESAANLLNSLINHPSGRKLSVHPHSHYTPTRSRPSDAGQALPPSSRPAFRPRRRIGRHSCA